MPSVWKWFDGRILGSGVGAALAANVVTRDTYHSRLKPLPQKSKKFSLDKQPHQHPGPRKRCELR